MKSWQSSLVVSLLVILSGTTAYYASRANYLQKQVRLQNGQTTNGGAVTPEPTTSEPTSSQPTSTAVSSAPSVSPSSSSTSTPTTTATAEVVTVAAADRLSQPAETYEVIQGDTLYAISLKQNMSLEKIAAANNLKDPFPLKLGQTLLVPNVNGAQNIFAVDFTADTNRITTSQQATDAGKNTWRLNPASVALAENSGAFGLKSTDQYVVKSSDSDKGQAVVTASQSVDGQTKQYQIDLTQPGKKGATGIWTIVRISPTS